MSNAFKLLEQNYSNQPKPNNQTNSKTNIPTSNAGFLNNDSNIESLIASVSLKNNSESQSNQTSKKDSSGNTDIDIIKNGIQQLNNTLVNEVPIAVKGISRENANSNRFDNEKRLNESHKFDAKIIGYARLTTIPARIILKRSENNFYNMHLFLLTNIQDLLRYIYIENKALRMSAGIDTNELHGSDILRKNEHKMKKEDEFRSAIKKIVKQIFEKENLNDRLTPDKLNFFDMLINPFSALFVFIPRVLEKISFKLGIREKYTTEQILEQIGFNKTNQEKGSLFLSNGLPYAMEEQTGLLTRIYGSLENIEELTRQRLSLLVGENVEMDQTKKIREKMRHDPSSGQFITEEEYDARYDKRQEVMRDMISMQRTFTRKTLVNLTEKLLPFIRVNNSEQVSRRGMELISEQGGGASARDALAMKAYKLEEKKESMYSKVIGQLGTSVSAALFALLAALGVPATGGALGALGALGSSYYFSQRIGTSNLDNLEMLNKITQAYGGGKKNKGQDVRKRPRNIVDDLLGRQDEGINNFDVNKKKDINITSMVFNKPIRSIIKLYGPDSNTVFLAGSMHNLMIIKRLIKKIIPTLTEPSAILPKEIKQGFEKLKNTILSFGILQDDWYGIISNNLESGFNKLGSMIFESVDTQLDIFETNQKIDNKLQTLINLFSKDPNTPSALVDTKILNFPNNPKPANDAAAASTGGFVQQSGVITFDSLNLKEKDYIYNNKDTVPANLSEGEVVIPSDIVQKYGLSFFKDIVSGVKNIPVEKEIDKNLSKEISDAIQSKAIDEGKIKEFVGAIFSSLANIEYHSSVSNQIADELLQKIFGFESLEKRFRKNNIAKLIKDEVEIQIINSTLIKDFIGSISKSFKSFDYISSVPTNIADKILNQLFGFNINERFSVKWYLPKKLSGIISKKLSKKIFKKIEDTGENNPLETIPNKIFEIFKNISDHDLVPKVKDVFDNLLDKIFGFETVDKKRGFIPYFKESLSEKITNQFYKELTFKLENKNMFRVPVNHIFDSIENIEFNFYKENIQELFKPLINRIFGFETVDKKRGFIPFFKESLSEKITNQFYKELTFKLENKNMFEIPVTNIFESIKNIDFNFFKRNIQNPFKSLITSLFKFKNINKKDIPFIGKTINQKITNSIKNNLFKYLTHSPNNSDSVLGKLKESISSYLSDNVFNYSVIESTGIKRFYTKLLNEVFAVDNQKTDLFVDQYLSGINIDFSLDESVKLQLDSEKINREITNLSIEKITDKLYETTIPDINLNIETSLVSAAINSYLEKNIISRLYHEIISFKIDIPNIQLNIKENEISNYITNYLKENLKEQVDNLNNTFNASINSTFEFRFDSGSNVIEFGEVIENIKKSLVQTISDMEISIVGHSVIPFGNSNEKGKTYLTIIKEKLMKSISDMEIKLGINNKLNITDLVNNIKKKINKFDFIELEEDTLKFGSNFTEDNPLPVNVINFQDFKEKKEQKSRIVIPGDSDFPVETRSVGGRLGSKLTSSGDSVNLTPNEFAYALNTFPKYNLGGEENYAFVGEKGKEIVVPGALNFSDALLNLHNGFSVETPSIVQGSGFVLPNNVVEELKGFNVKKFASGGSTSLEQSNISQQSNKSVIFSISSHLENIYKFLVETRDLVRNRALLTGLLTAAFGPLGPMIGQAAGDAIASMISGIISTIPYVIQNTKLFKILTGDIKSIFNKKDKDENINVEKKSIGGLIGNSKKKIKEYGVQILNSDNFVSRFFKRFNNFTNNISSKMENVVFEKRQIEDKKLKRLQNIENYNEKIYSLFSNDLFFRQLKLAIKDPDARESIKFAIDDSILSDAAVIIRKGVESLVARFVVNSAGNLAKILGDDSTTWEEKTEALQETITTEGIMRTVAIAGVGTAFNILFNKFKKFVSGSFDPYAPIVKKLFKGLGGTGLGDNLNDIIFKSDDEKKRSRLSKLSEEGEDRLERTEEEAHRDKMTDQFSSMNEILRKISKRLYSREKSVVGNILNILKGFVPFAGIIGAGALAYSTISGLPNITSDEGGTSITPLITFGVKAVSSQLKKLFNPQIGVKILKTLGLGFLTSTAGAKALGTVAKNVGMAIPGLGMIVGTGFAIKRLTEGDYVGALIEFVSGLPGIGLLKTVMLTGGLALKDFLMPSPAKSEDSPKSNGDFLNELWDGIVSYGRNIYKTLETAFYNMLGPFADPVRDFINGNTGKEVKIGKDKIELTTNNSLADIIDKTVGVIGDIFSGTMGYLNDLKNDALGFLAGIFGKSKKEVVKEQLSTTGKASLGEGLTAKGRRLGHATLDVSSREGFEQLIDKDKRRKLKKTLDLSKNEGMEISDDAGNVIDPDIVGYGLNFIEMLMSEHGVDDKSKLQGGSFKNAQENIIRPKNRSYSLKQTILNNEKDKQMGHIFEYGGPPQQLSFEQAAVVAEQFNNRKNEKGYSIVEENGIYKIKKEYSGKTSGDWNLLTGETEIPKQFKKPKTIYEFVIPDEMRREEGGPVEKGKPYLVGEHGKPELVVPKEDGRVVSLNEINSWVEQILNRNRNIPTPETDAVYRRLRRNVSILNSDNPQNIPIETSSSPRVSTQNPDKFKKLGRLHTLSSEGVSVTAYDDSDGHSVGVGHFIKPGEEHLKEGKVDFKTIKKLFDEDFESHKKAAEKIPGYDMIHPAGKRALEDMTFNMGPGWISEFPDLKKALIGGDYVTAAKEVLDSNYAKQVKSRAARNAGLILTGDPSFFKSSIPQIVDDVERSREEVETIASFLMHPNLDTLANAKESFDSLLQRGGKYKDLVTENIGNIQSTDDIKKLILSEISSDPQGLASSLFDEVRQSASGDKKNDPINIPELGVTISANKISEWNKSYPDNPIYNEDGSINRKSLSTLATSIAVSQSGPKSYSEPSIRMGESNQPPSTSTSSPSSRTQPSTQPTTVNLGSRSAPTPQNPQNLSGTNVTQGPEEKPQFTKINPEFDYIVENMFQLTNKYLNGRIIDYALENSGL